jgi:hypothetical protein
MAAFWQQQAAPWQFQGFGSGLSELGLGEQWENMGVTRIYLIE